LESALEYTLGIEIDHYVEIDFAGFSNLIDELGGVDIDVPQRMYKPYENIDLQKGPQTLNGYDALAFVRFRDLPMGDIDRIQNQQMFLHALAAKVAGISLVDVPALVGIGIEHTNTNYTLLAAVDLGKALRGTNLSNIPMYSLPGRALYIGFNNFWILDKKGTMDIIAEITGGVVGTFHIIDDEGQGTLEPPGPPVEDVAEDIEDEAENGDAEELPAQNGDEQDPEEEDDPAAQEAPPQIPEPPTEQQPTATEPPPAASESSGIS